MTTVSGELPSPHGGGAFFVAVGASFDRPKFLETLLRMKGGRMWYQTLAIDEQGMHEAIDDLTTRINAFSKRHEPFRIVVKEEQLHEKMGLPVLRFHLVLTPDFEVKSEKQAWQFCQKMKEAAQEVDDMNSWNYFIVPEPRRNGPMGGMKHA